MFLASQRHARRAIGVLLGGPFAPQRSNEPQPVVCALLRSRPGPVGAVGHPHSTASTPVATHQAVGDHG